MKAPPSHQLFNVYKHCTHIKSPVLRQKNQTEIDSTNGEETNEAMHRGAQANDEADKMNKVIEHV